MAATPADADPYATANAATKQVLHDDLKRAYDVKKVELEEMAAVRGHLAAEFQTTKSELLHVREQLTAALKEKAKVEDAESELLQQKQAVGSLEQELDIIKGVLREVTAERDQALELARAAEHKLAILSDPHLTSDVADIKQWFSTGETPTFANDAFPDLEQLRKVRPAYPPVYPILSDPSVCYRMSARCNRTSRSKAFTD